VASVLLVDHEELLRNRLSQELLKSGHIVHQATGATALTVLEHCDQGIDMLITDVLTPGVNGVNLALAILQQCPGIPIIFMSGYGEEIMARYPEAPKAVFLMKPFSPSHLARIVVTLLTLRSIQDAREPVLGDPAADRKGNPVDSEHLLQHGSRISRALLSGRIGRSQL
jgi:DNA-binding NtrC family response regulator